MNQHIPNAMELSNLLTRLELNAQKRPLPAIVEVNTADVLKIIRLLRSQGISPASVPIRPLKGKVVKRGNAEYREY
mgnify:CR=1 FL=1